MSTMITPPQMPPGPVPPLPGPTPSAPSSSPAPRSSSRVVAILTIALGSAVILGSIGVGAVSAVAAATVRTEQTRTLAVDGVSRLDVDVSAGSAKVRFGDVTQATLDVTGGNGQWTFERAGDRLTLSSPSGILAVGWFSGGSGDAVLTLPRALEDTPMDALLTVSAGSLDAEGTYGKLGIDMSAGAATVRGTAETVAVNASAGRADLGLRDVREADLALSAGEIIARLSGSAPDLVTVDISAGSLALTLPADRYAVDVDASAGSLVNRLDTSPGAAHRVKGQVSAGSVLLKESN